MVSSWTGTPASNAMSPTRAGSSASTTSSSPSPVALRPARSSAARSSAGRGERTTTWPPAVRRDTGPCSTSRPRWITTTSSTVCATSASTWLETSTVRPSAGHAAQEVAQPADALRVEAVGGLVEDQHARVAEQRRRQPEPLAHAERVLAGAPAGGALELDEPEHLVHARPREPGHRRQRAQVVAALAAGMRARDLQVGADHPRRLVELDVRLPEDRRVARAGPRERQDHPQRRRLARAVGPEEPGHRALADRERQVVDRGHGSVALRKPHRLDRRHGGAD